MLKNKKGQSLVEYLVIVALVAVGSISVVRVVSGNINARFANVANILGGKAAGTNVEVHEVTKSMTQKKDLSNFFEGAQSPKKK